MIKSRVTRKKLLFHVPALFQKSRVVDPDPGGKKLPTKFFFKFLVIKTLDSELNPDPQLGKMPDPYPD
jgi:hypothetical protein